MKTLEKKVLSKKQNKFFEFVVKDVKKQMEKIDILIAEIKREDKLAKYWAAEEMADEMIMRLLLWDIDTIGFCPYYSYIAQFLKKEWFR